jgi:hypothetical protein|nr:MAG TPA: hypothetical protein [Caudoviricetes sp.]
MSEIKFESKDEKLYVVKLDDTAIGRLFKNKEGFWKISLGQLDDQDLYTLLNSLNKEPCEIGAPLLKKTMNYAYRFKNPDIETALNVLCGKDYVQKAIREQYYNSNEPINFKFPDSLSECVKWGHISVCKSEIERVREYDPDDWNPFPEVNPPECGEYLVTFKDEDADYVQQNYFDMLGRWETAHSDVIAFRALPAPYQPKEDK